MSCYNCNDRGGTMVRGRDGESDFDPCNECDAFSKQVKAQERCAKVRSAMANIGFRTVVSQRQALIQVGKCQVQATPVYPGPGDWKVLFAFAPIADQDVETIRAVLNTI